MESVIVSKNDDEIELIEITEDDEEFYTGEYKGDFFYGFPDDPIKTENKISPTEIKTKEAKDSSSEEDDFYGFPDDPINTESSETKTINLGTFNDIQNEIINFFGIPELLELFNGNFCFDTKYNLQKFNLFNFFNFRSSNRH